MSPWDRGTTFIITFNYKKRVQTNVRTNAHTPCGVGLCTYGKKKRKSKCKKPERCGDDFLQLAGWFFVYHVFISSVASDVVAFTQNSTT